jgi:hypothetical protein
MRKSKKEVHEVHWTFCFMSLGSELVTFPHVHEVHDVHAIDQQFRETYSMGRRVPSTPLRYAQDFGKAPAPLTPSKRLKFTKFTKEQLPVVRNQFYVVKERIPLPTDRLDMRFFTKNRMYCLILHFSTSCQAKQGAVVDVVWNQ